MSVIEGRRPKVGGGGCSSWQPFPPSSLPLFLLFAFALLPYSSLPSNLPSTLEFLQTLFCPLLLRPNLSPISAPKAGDLIPPRLSFFQKSVLLELIQEIEPLDVSHIQKDVPPTTVDAMKRIISGMLGLLPSDQFQVVIEALWEPLSKLLIHSMITGYTLRNAEFRLCLEKNLDMHERDLENTKAENTELDVPGLLLDSVNVIDLCGRNNLSSEAEKLHEETSGNIDIQNLGEMSAEVQQYIYNLQSRLSSIKKELNEVKRKTAALQMQQFVGEEKNDLLDYLRSLQPEQVAELSESTSSELKNTIHSVVHGLLATLSPKMHSKASTMSENASAGTVNAGTEDCAEFVENTSLQFQPVISLTRDYLARLLFWCMLLGHYLRGLEYRVELMELLSLTCEN
ncbi:seed maturation protein PM23 [Senna tora]|uniref:Seed maturation protein PM23 n=1 Tax=Senna tora TaxID=362788 RepID=A0A834SWU2_9FABA|nr:seed maturation protein PM23 [Senna tora]